MNVRVAVQEESLPHCYCLEWYSFPGVDNTQQGRKNACRLRATTNLLEPNAGLGQS
jgi:hypothetical protein